MSGEITSLAHLTRLIDDLVKRLDRYEETQKELLTGFPERYASRSELEKLREDAVELQTTIVGRDRFELLEKQVSENSGRRTATIALAGIVTAGIVALLSWNISQLNEANALANQNRKEIASITNELTELHLKFGSLQEKLQLLCRQEAKEDQTIC